MSYTPTNWQTGDIITAERLNKLENGVAALSNYDIVFTQTYDDNDNDVFTADGLSVEELYQKGARNLNALSITGDTVRKPIAYSLYIEDGVTYVSFKFLTLGSAVAIFCIGTDGTANINGNGATFTYSNGHYTFTLTEESGGGGGEE